MRFDLLAAFHTPGAKGCTEGAPTGAVLMAIVRLVAPVEIAPFNPTTRMCLNRSQRVAGQRRDRTAGNTQRRQRPAAEDQPRVDALAARTTRASRIGRFTSAAPTASRMSINQTQS
jgi:hypothetical protein